MRQRLTTRALSQIQRARNESSGKKRNKVNAQVTFPAAEKKRDLWVPSVKQNTAATNLAASRRRQGKKGEQGQPRKGRDKNAETGRGGRAGECTKRRVIREWEKKRESMRVRR